MADLKMKVETLEGVDEKYHDLYTEKDGQFVANVPGAKSIEDYNELYNSANDYKSQLETATAKLASFGEIDPDTVASDLTELKTLREQVGNTDVTALSKENASLVQENNKLRATNTTLQGNYDTLKEKDDKRTAQDRLRTIDDAVEAAYGDSLTLEAMKDAKAWGRIHLKLDANGVVVTNDQAGMPENLGIDGYVSEMKQIKRHWLRDNTSAGANGGDAGAAGPAGVENPWKKGEGFNRTKQSVIRRDNPELAKQLMKAAGIKVD